MLKSIRDEHRRRMVHIMLIAAAILVVGGVGGVLVAGARGFSLSHSTEEAFVSLDAPSTLDFGEAACGAAVPFTIVLRNDGDIDARISTISASCSCTSLPGGPVSVPSGEAAEISGILHTNRMQTMPTTGSTVSFHSPGGRSLAVKLRVSHPAPIRDDGVAWATNGDLILPVHPAYRSRIVDVFVYPHGRDEVLRLELNADSLADAVSVRVTDRSLREGTTIDIVCVLQGESGKDDVYKISQEHRI